MPITTLPTPPSRNDSVNFPARGDSFLAALPQFAAEANALALDVSSRQVQITNNALAAQGDRITCAAAASSPAVVNAAANAAAAQAAAAAAQIYASAAQATNPDSPIRINPRRVTANFTVSSAHNASSVGPLTVAEGIVVTVGDNATWSIH